MNTARPKTITTILVCLLMLAVLSTVTAITSTRLGGNNRINRTAGATAQGANGNFQGNNAAGQGTDGTTQGNNGTGTRTNGNFQGRTQSGFNLFSITRSLGLSPFVFVYFNLGFTILGILLLLLSAYGIWKSKIWGLNLGTVLAIIFLVGAVPGLFSMSGRFVNWLRIGTTILNLLATLPILALCLLPSVRDYFPKKKTIRK